MRKAEAESAIRYLSAQWYRDLPEDEKEHPSFGSFKNWLHENGYGQYLAFNSTMGANYDAEMWFDSALGQSWRN